MFCISSSIADEVGFHVLLWYLPPRAPRALAYRAFALIPARNNVRNWPCTLISPFMASKKVILYSVQSLLRKLIQQGSSACVINVVLVSASSGLSLATRAEAGAPCGSSSDPEREIFKIGGSKTPTAIPKGDHRWDLCQKVMRWRTRSMMFVYRDGETASPRDPRVGVQGHCAMT